MIALIIFFCLKAFGACECIVQCTSDHTCTTTLHYNAFQCFIVTAVKTLTIKLIWSDLNTWFRDT